MRFCHPFILTTNARDAEQALARHKRIGAKSGVQYDHPPFMVLFPRVIFLQPIFLRKIFLRKIALRKIALRTITLRKIALSKIARPTAGPRNLTEFPFGPNFSQLDLEGL
jgi:hypothetical protein